MQNYTYGGLLQDSLRVELSLEIYMSLFFFTKQFLFLKILKPFFKKQLILLLKCSWFGFFLLSAGPFSAGICLVQWIVGFKTAGN